MKYKALFLDIDGTLVKHGLEYLPTPRVSAAINQISSKMHVCLATGRILPHIEDIVSHLKLSGLCVISNGIQIYDPQKQSIIWEKPLSKEAVPFVYETLKKYSSQIRQFDGWDEYPFDGNVEKNNIYCLWIDQVKPQIVDSIMKDLSIRSDISANKIISYKKNLLSLIVSHAEASKLHGIVEVAKRLNINTQEMIGVGDGYNDFPLLMACGLKIAMGNAVEELKAIADFIAPSVEEDGVATVIEKFILNLQ